MKKDADGEFLTNTGQAFDVFSSYWSYGFDAEAGRDSYMLRPDNAKESAVHRLHLRPVKFKATDKGTSSQKCWDEWEFVADVPSRETGKDRVPTSNEWVIYCVDENRDACMIAYLPEHMDPHKVCEDMSVMKRFIGMANDWFKSKSSEPMEVSELPLVFDDKWLR
ncbi:hypothetical protein AB4158_13260 [Vibrio splendidus]